MNGWICAVRLDSTFITIESETLKEDIDNLTEGRGVDVCITACPAPQAQQIALELAAINGRVIFFGGLPADKAHVSLNTNLIHYKQLEVTGTTRQSLSQYRRTLRLVASGRINIKDLISPEPHWKIFKVRWITYPRLAA